MGYDTFINVGFLLLVVVPAAVVYMFFVAAFGWGMVAAIKDKNMTGAIVAAWLTSFLLWFGWLLLGDPQLQRLISGG